MSEPKLTEIAARIDAHLRRFASTPSIASEMFDYGNGRPVQRTHYYQSSAYRGGAKVMVNYVSFQGAMPLTRDEAISYLSWLDAGNIGHHHEATKTLTP